MGVSISRSFDFAISSHIFVSVTFHPHLFVLVPRCRGFKMKPQRPGTHREQRKRSIIGFHSAQTKTNHKVILPVEASMISSTGNHEVLETMRMQEESEAYTLPIKRLVKSLTTPHDRSDNIEGTKKLSQGMADYISWRRQMATWCIQISKMLDQQIETVEVALSILDRAPAADPKLAEDPETYQLACVGSLYIATKLYEKKQLSLGAMTHLCLNRFYEYQIEAMELRLLASIQWRVNPPTAVSFARLLLKIARLHENHREILIMEEVKKQVEKAVVEEYFLTVKASTLAFAAVMNGLQQVKSKKPMYYFELFRDALGYGDSAPSRFIDVCNRLFPSGGGIADPCLDNKTSVLPTVANECIGNRLRKSHVRVASCPDQFRQ